MSQIGWYYLHENGSLIYKRETGGTAADIRESNLARGLWPFDPNDRESVWRICIEGLASDADKERVLKLATQWQCDNTDAAIYAERVGCSLYMDGDQWCATGPHFVNLQESAAGFGTTCLEAMADLCKKLRYRPSKMWGMTFSGLLRKTAEDRGGVRV